MLFSNTFTLPALIRELLDARCASVLPLEPEHPTNDDHGAIYEHRPDALGLNRTCSSQDSALVSNEIVTTNARSGQVLLHGTANRVELFDRFSVGLNVENLANKQYISGIAPELMTSPSTVGRYFIGAPRTVVLWAKLEI